MKLKLRSTTPQLKQLATKTVLVVGALLMAAAVPVSVFADRYQDQIDAISSEINSYQAEANRLRGEANTLQNAINVLSAEKNAIQADINLNQAKSDQLTEEIGINTQKLERQKGTLSKTIAQIYANGTTTPIVMLASTTSVGEYVSAQEVRNSVRSQLKSAMDEVKRLKKTLESQKAEVESILADQKGRRDKLAAKEAEQAELLAATQGQEAAYQNLISNSNAQIDSLRAQQRAANAALGGRSNNSGDPSKGGYTYNNTARPGWSMYGCWPDEWGMCARQCVSYTAFKWEQKTGHMPYWGGEYADAKNWANLARQYGYNTGYTPQVGSVAVSTAGGWGHVMWVEQVSGGMIYVSQYNYGMDGEYSEMWVSAGGLEYIYLN